MPEDKLLGYPLRNEISAVLSVRIVTHVYRQTSLEILGSRLADEEHFDDDFQETGYV